MGNQEQLQRRAEPKSEEVQDLPEIPEQNTDILEVTDKILDEIDIALEGLDQNMAIEYRQSGGE